MKVDQQDEQSALQYFSELLKLHHRELLVYARTLTQEEHHAKDITQDAFVSAWEHIGVFDVTRDFGAWMRGIIRNKWREWLRKTKRVTSIDDAALESFEFDLQGWEAMKLNGGPSVFHKLEDCMKELPDTLTGAVKAFYGQGYTTDEAAEKLNINGATLRKRLERARQGLRQCIQGIEDETQDSTE